MKASIIAATLLSALVSAAPAPQAGTTTGATSNDIQNGQCGDVAFVMARGSTEPGNMVRPSQSNLVVEDRLFLTF